MNKRQEEGIRCTKCTSLQPITKEPARAKNSKDESTSTPCWWDKSTITEPTTQHKLDENPWSEVARRKERSKPPDKSPTQKDTGQEPDRNYRENSVKQKRQRIKPCGMIIDQGTEDFPEIGKRIRTGLEKQKIGDKISRRRKKTPLPDAIAVKPGQGETVTV